MKTFLPFASLAIAVFLILLIAFAVQYAAVLFGAFFIVIFGVIVYEIIKSKLL